jgi:AbrB family looped-hinge helix DNA binding protein
MSASSNSIGEALASTKIGENGQVTVPKKLRRGLHLVPGTSVAMIRMGDALILLPQQEEFERATSEMQTILARAGITAEDVLATLPATRQRLFKQRYGVAMKNRKLRA